MLQCFLTIKCWERVRHLASHMILEKSHRFPTTALAGYKIVICENVRFCSAVISKVVEFLGFLFYVTLVKGLSEHLARVTMCKSKDFFHCYFHISKTHFLCTFINIINK